MNDEPRLRVIFYRTARGNEPVREWLKALPPEERKIIGDDLKTAQYGWPLGMPLIRKLETGLWEVRSRLQDCIARMASSRNRRSCRCKTYNWRDSGCNHCGGSEWIR